MDEREVMTLTVNVPDRVVLQRHDVSRVVVESVNGSNGLYPHRLDCIMPLVPGIIVYETANAGDLYLAVDEGVLVKMGLKVIVSVRNAIPGTDLQAMQALVERSFLSLSEQDQQIRAVLSRIEDEFVRMFQEVHT